MKKKILKPRAAWTNTNTNLPMEMEIMHERLSDGSSVYSLWIGDYAIDCVTEDHAKKCLEIIQEAIEVATGLKAS